MSELKATPGPWSVFIEDIDGYGVDGPDGEAVVWTPAGKPKSGIYEIEDAHLIAAAPDLYAVLEAIYEGYQSDAENGVKWLNEQWSDKAASLCPSILAEIGRIPDLLEKARGETE